MRYRVWHMLVAMVFVAIWLPLSKWLLKLEAMDHPTIPQTTADYIGFYLGTITIVGFPLVVIVLIIKKWRHRVRSSRETQLKSGSTPSFDAKP